MRRLMALIAARRVDLTPLVTHRFMLEDIGAAYDLFSHQRGGVMKVVLHPTIAGDHQLEPALVTMVDESC